MRAQYVGWRLVFSWHWQGKRVNMVVRRERNVKIPPADSFGKVFVFFFRANNNNINIKHERSDNLKLCGVGFSGSGTREHNRIVLLHSKAFKEHERIVVCINTVEYPAVCGKIK